ncbi:hypothetical protein D3Z36_04145 [Lachnospiraceae bacterium]|nr:hypothetical protein [Lachnospiraceae bacterium]
MKKLRKNISLFLIPLLVFGLVSPQFSQVSVSFAQEVEEKPVSGMCGENVQWEVTEDTEAEWDLEEGTPYKLILTGTGEMDFGEDVAPPWYLNGYHKTITSVSIAEGITCIPRCAFYYCVSLKSITLPDSITEIGESAFGSCSLLETLVCGTGLKTIGDTAFYDDVSLVSVQFQEGLESIGEYAFADCEKLSDIPLPDSLTSLGIECFRKTAITSLTISRNMSVVPGAFLRGTKTLQSLQCAEGNVNFQVVDNVLYELKEGKPYRAIAYAVASPSTAVQIQEGTQIVDEWAFAYAHYLTSLSLPSTLKEIKASAFSSCQSLRELSIPDGVETIADEGFWGCGITKVTVGKGLRAMPGAIFGNCTKLATVIISEENPYLEAIDNVVYNREHTIFYFYPAAKPDHEYHVLDTVESLANYCIEKANALKELYMPKNLVRLGQGSLRWNYNLNAIYFQGNAPQLAFESIRENGKKLLIYYTASASGFDSSNWQSYNLVLWDPDNPVLDEGSFEGISWKYQGDIGRIQFTGSGKIPDFTQEDPAPWNAYMDMIQTIESEGITEIGAYAFYGAKKLLRFETAGLKRVGAYAFADCGKLLFIDVEGTETIEAGAFQNDGSIQGELVLKEISSIGAGGFEGCASLTTVVLGNQMQTLEERVFAGCASMAEFLVPESVSVIKSEAFMESGLRTINLPVNVHTIEAQAFQGNAALEKVYFYGGIPENWAEDSFQECGKLTICYRKFWNEWARLGDSWNGIPLMGLDRFYTERRDHYSFNNSAASFGYPANYRIPRQRYVDILNSIISGSYYYAVDGNWNGSCYGMAGTTLEFYENQNFQVADYDANAKNLYDLAAPGHKDAALTKLIEAYQISQCKGAIGGCGGLLSRNRGKYLEMILKVEEFERSGGLYVDSQAEPILMVVYSAYAAHVVIPVSVEQVENGDFEMKVYDPNQPSAMQTLTIKKDFSEISYKFYSYASYLNYSVVAAAMSGVELQSETAEESLYLSIDKKDATVENKDGKGIEEIEGAYEQKLFETEQEDVFSGIRSFVLPKGSYQLAAGQESSDSAEDAITFYVASEENFAEITSSDEHAVLEVIQPETEEEKVELVLKSESTEEETAQFTLMNEEGMERTIEIEGSNAAVTVTGDDTIAIQASKQEKISVDGQELELADGKAAASFAVSKEENPFKAKDSEINVNCDAKNKLNGTISFAIISGDRTPKNAALTASFVGHGGEKIASYTQNAVLNPGRNYITMSLEELETSFAEQEGEMELTCEIEIVPQEGDSFTFKLGECIVSLTSPEEPDPEEPKPGPEEPDPEEPKPGPEEPDPEEPKPGPEEPDPEEPKPDPEEPDKKPDIAVIKINIDKKNLTLGAGESYPLTVSVLPHNATDKTLVFQAMNDKVEVSREGIITAKKPGTSYVLVKAANGKQEMVTVTVKKAPDMFTLNAREKKLNPKECFQIEVNLPADTASNRITYSSSDESVAAVSGEGKVTAAKEGKAVITVETFNGRKAELQVTVKKEIAVKEVKVPVKKLIMGAGETCALGASVLPQDATNRTLSYETSNNKVTVSAKGKIKAKKVGTSRITVRAANGKYAKILVKVRKAPAKITLNASKKTLKKGKTFQIKIKLPDNTASRKITYSSSKKAVASVSSTGKITAKKRGKAVITVKTFNNKKARLKITVK